MTKSKQEAFLMHVNGEVQMEIPFLNDLDKKTPLDICLDITPQYTNEDDSSEKSCCSMGIRGFFSAIKGFCQRLRSKADNSDEAVSRNFMLANLLLENIKDYSRLHCS